MNYLTIQSKTATEEGLLEVEVNANVDQIMLIAKQPFTPTLVHMAGVAHMTESNIPDELPGLVTAETKEGGKVWFNPKFVQFYFTPQIGMYNLAFPGGVTLSLPITKEDLLRKLGEEFNEGIQSDMDWLDS